MAIRPTQAALAALALALGAGSGLVWAAETAPPGQINIDNFIFAPGAVDIPAGTTVTWTNRDDIPHKVAADDLSWKSAALDTGDAFSRRFETPGTYKYFCALHPKMTGTIVVR